MHGVVGAALSARSEKASEFSEKPSEKSEAMRLLKLAAEPRPAGDSVKGAIRRAAGLAGFSEGRAADIWYGEAHRISSREMDALRTIERKTFARFLASDYRKHVEQLAALRARLQSRDAEFHRADCDAISFLLDELQQALQR